MPSSTGRVFHFSPFVSIKNPCKTGTDLGEGCRGWALGGGGGGGGGFPPPPPPPLR